MCRDISTHVQCALFSCLESPFFLLGRALGSNSLHDLRKNAKTAVLCLRTTQLASITSLISPAKTQEKRLPTPHIIPFLSFSPLGEHWSPPVEPGRTWGDRHGRKTSRGRASPELPRFIGRRPSAGQLVGVDEESMKRRKPRRIQKANGFCWWGSTDCARIMGSIHNLK